MTELEERRALAQQVRSEYLGSPSFIEAQFKSQAVELICRDSEVYGVARLVMLQPMVRESVHTVVFRKTAIQYQRAQGCTAFWHSIPKYGFEPGSHRLTEFFGDPFEPKALEQIKLVVELEDGRLPKKSTVPKVLSSYRELKSSALCIGPRGEQDVTGVTYYLLLCDQFERSDIRWCDPTRPYNPEIWQVLDAFDEMAEQAENPPVAEPSAKSDDDSEPSWWQRWRRS